MTTSPEAHETYQQLQAALIKGEVSSVSNLQILGDVFFPKGKSEPVCVPITYTSLCHDDTSANISAQYSGFLWTQNYIPYSTSILLLSYSKSGITLKGFEWEKSCVFMDETEISLQFNLSNCSSNAVLNDSLLDLTSQVCCVVGPVKWYALINRLPS